MFIQGQKTNIKNGKKNSSSSSNHELEPSSLCNAYDQVRAHTPSTAGIPYKWLVKNPHIKPPK